jgi:hypothetical protein
LADAAAFLDIISVDQLLNKGEIAISPFKNAHFAKTRHCALKNKWHFTVIAITPVFIIVNSNS